MTLRGFEVADVIFDRVKHRTDKNLEKIDDVLKSQTHKLYFTRKVELSQLVKEK